MSKKVKVAAIEIRYPGGGSKKLSIEDARELHEQLNELFGDKTVVVPSSPVIIERDRWPRWGPIWSSGAPDNTASHSLAAHKYLDQKENPQPERLLKPEVWCCEAQNTNRGE